MQRSSYSTVELFDLTTQNTINGYRLIDLLSVCMPTCPQLNQSRHTIHPLVHDSIV